MIIATFQACGNGLRLLFKTLYLQSRQPRMNSQFRKESKDGIARRIYLRLLQLIITLPDIVSAAQ